MTCGDHATCDLGVCECDDGYALSGEDCVDVDECATDTDDCTDNAECENTVGSYRCNCDMLGTYAGVLYTEVSWKGVGSGLFLDGSAVLPSFELRTVTAQANGALEMTVEACGGTTADFCIVPQYAYTPQEPEPGDPPITSFPSAGYGQDFPKSLWARLGTVTANIPMPLVAEGEPFMTSDQAAFLGLSLVGDPLQAWPTDRNSDLIVWEDPDDDNVPGTTSLARHVDRNGNPEYDDVGESVECAAAFPPASWDDPNTEEVETTWDDPNTFDVVETLPYPFDRIDYLDVTWPYDYWLSGVSTPKVKAFHAGARTVSRFDGAITECGRIQGDLVVSQINARLHGCVDEDDQPCSESVVDTLDGADDPNTIEGGCFQFIRVDPGATCETVRAHAFDLLVSGRCPVAAN